MSSDLFVITSYFNPARYETKRANFETFVRGIELAGVNLLVAELAFGDAPFELPSGAHVLQLRGSGVMWQKERLLNIAAQRLPRSCRKVVWLDCDVIFENQDWARQTADALNRFVVVQPFSRAIRLEPGEVAPGKGAQPVYSFAKVFSAAPFVARAGQANVHGDTGFAWAARREFFDHCGLYDAALTGSGDHLMAHAFVGGMHHSPCVKRRFNNQLAYAKHFMRWATRARDFVDSRLGVVVGDLLHLWHGDMKDRRYSEVIQEFAAFNFDPDRDLQLDVNGLWAWKSASPELRHWTENMFGLRREDGDAGSAVG